MYSLKEAFVHLLNVAANICVDKEERMEFKKWLIKELGEFE